MLSSDEPPDPLEEIRWHAAQCEAGGRTALITTRRLTGLSPGRSTVGFYGNAALDNRYLGRAVFHEYVGLDSPRGMALLWESPLYRQRGTPGGARAFLILDALREARDGENLEVLRGTIQASGRKLTRENLPRGAARIQVYYV